jgi:predicted nucleic acid-binding protein
MLVIADSSPLIVLVNIGYVSVLPALFGQVTIPPQVADELIRPNRPQAVRDFIAEPSTWLNIQSPKLVEPIRFLQSGEAAAISLAREISADLLLIDEVRGRRAATQRKIKLTGTVGVLELAASRNMLDLRDAFEQIKKTDFWISHKLLDDRLNLYRKSASTPKQP